MCPAPCDAFVCFLFFAIGLSHVLAHCTHALFTHRQGENIKGEKKKIQTRATGRYCARLGMARGIANILLQGFFQCFICSVRKYRVFGLGVQSEPEHSSFLESRRLMLRNFNLWLEFPWKITGNLALGWHWKFTLKSRTSRNFAAQSILIFLWNSVVAKDFGQSHSSL